MGWLDLENIAPFIHENLHILLFTLLEEKRLNLDDGSERIRYFVSGYFKYSIVIRKKNQYL